LPVSFPVLFEILPGVVEPDLVLLQETVEFIAGLKPEEAAELGGGQLAFAVPFESDGFESGTFQVLPGHSQKGGKLVWQIQGDARHGGSIA